MKNKFNPLISIIIPVYNGANFLEEAIESALAQTYQKIEIVVVNDGSNDAGRTEEISKKFENKTHYVSKARGGVASALNVGIREARGQYISWLSHDDVYLSHKLESQVQFLSSLKNKEIILYSNYELIDKNSSPLKSIIHDHDMLSNKSLYAILRGCLHGCSMLIPKTLLMKHGLFDEALGTTQDYALWFKMAINSVSFIHMPRTLIQSRWHDEQDSKKNPNTLRESNELWINFTRQLNEERMLMCESSPYIFYKKLADFLENTPYTEAYKHVLRLKEKARQSLEGFAQSRLVSIIIPFYNRISYTIDCVKSVIDQTHQNFEILLIDNNSTEWVDELKMLIAGDVRIKMLHEPQQGAANARNLGLRHATGDYICFLDSDDLWLDTKIEKQLKYMLLEDKNITYTGYYTFDEKGSVVEICDGLPNYSFPQIIKQCRIALPTVMLNRSVLSGRGLSFPSAFTVAEDICLWIAISKFNKISFFNASLTRVRIHSDNAAYCSDAQLIGLINILSYVVNQYDLDSIRAEVFCLLGVISAVIKSKEMAIVKLKKLKIIRQYISYKLINLKNFKFVRFVYFRLPNRFRAVIRKLVIIF